MSSQARLVHGAGTAQQDRINTISFYHWFTTELVDELCLIRVGRRFS